MRNACFISKCMFYKNVMIFRCDTWQKTTKTSSRNIFLSFLFMASIVAELAELLKLEKPRNLPWKLQLLQVYNKNTSTLQN